MRKLIYLIIFLFTLGSFAQGGPKVDVIKFRGEVTTTVRNTFDVPTGETWLIWNETEKRLELAESDDVWKTGITSGTNDIDEGIYLKQSDFNAIEILPDGSVGGTDYVRIRGGESPNEVYLYLTNNYVALEGYSNADIDATGDNSLTTKRWVDSKAVLKSGSTMSGTLSMGSNPINGISNLSYSGYIDGANELRLTPDDGIGSTSGKNSFSFKTGNVAFMKKIDATQGLGLDFNALTTSKNLEFTDTDILWGGASLVSSSGSLLTSPNIWTDSNLFEGNVLIGDEGVSGGQLVMIGDPTGDTSQIVFYDSGFTSPLAALGYNTTQDGIYLVNASSTKYLTLQDTGLLTYNGDMTVEDEAYNATSWNGSLEVPTKNALRDKIESLTTSVSDGSISTAKLADGAVTSTKILDGTILNADINASAGIAATKIAYDNSTSGTSEDDLQGVADEIYNNIGTLTGNISANAVDIALNETTIDSIKTVLATVATSTFEFTTKTADYTNVLADAKDNVILNLDYDDESVTVPSGVFSSGHAIRYKIAQGAAGDAYIKQGVGVDIVGYTDGVTLTGYPCGITLTRVSTATSPEIWEVTDFYGSPVDYVVAGCTPDANEKYITANAASDPNCNEADATTGWTTGGTGTTVTTSTDSTDGTYSLVGNTTGGVPAWIQYNFSVTSGDTYTISFNAKKATSDFETKITNWTGLTGSPSAVNITTSWVTYSYDVTASSTGTATIRFYVSAGSGGTSSNKFYADNISIIKTN